MATASQRITHGLGRSCAALRMLRPSTSTRAPGKRPAPPQASGWWRCWRHPPQLLQRRPKQRLPRLWQSERTAAHVWRNSSAVKRRAARAHFNTTQISPAHRAEQSRAAAAAAGPPESAPATGSSCLRALCNRALHHARGADKVHGLRCRAGAHDCFYCRPGCCVQRARTKGHSERKAIVHRCIIGNGHLMRPQHASWSGRHATAAAPPARQFTQLPPGLARPPTGRPHLPSGAPSSK